MEIIIQISTLIVSVCVLVLNIVFSRIEKSREYFLGNVTKQRICDMLEMRKISATICMLTNATLVKQKVNDVSFQETLIIESKKMDFLLKRYYKEDREVIDIKEWLINYVVNYCNNTENSSITQIQESNKLFNKIAELFNYTAWQCIKAQATGEKFITTTEFSVLYTKYRTNYLTTEDEICIKNILSS
jgi:hypothetical protein